MLAKFLDRFLGMTGIEDKPRQENLKIWMAVARGLKVTHNVHEKVMAIRSEMQLEGVNDKVRHVRDKVHDIDDRIKGVER
jgi:hypothetical protein